MIIEINEEYRIKSNTSSWNIEKYIGHDKDTNERTFTPIRYYMNLEAAVKGLADLQIREISDRATIGEIKKVLQVIREEVRKALNNIPATQR